MKIKNIPHSLEYPLPDDIQSNLPKELDVLEKRYPRVNLVLTAEPMKVIKTSLETAHSFKQAVYALLNELCDRVGSTAANVRLQLRNERSLQQSFEKEFEKINNARQALTNFSIDNLTVPDEMEKVGELLGDVTQSMVNCINFIVEKYPDIVEVVQGLRNEGKYIESVSKIKSSIDAERERGTGILGKMEMTREMINAEEAEAREKSLSFFHRDKLPVKSFVIIPPSHVPRSLQLSSEWIELEMEKTKREIIKAKLLQTLFAAIGLTVIAYFIFKGTFIGTPEDFLQVFLWGFTTDVGVNFFVDKAKEFAKPK